MIKAVKKISSDISIEFDKTLTGNACAHIACEIVKYVMLQKQQIPLAFDSLVKYSKQPQTVKKNFSMMTNFIDSMKSMSDNLNEQFALNDCDIKEIIILVGATIFTPKLCIRIEMPPDILDSHIHTNDEHNVRTPLLNIMSLIFQCSEFQDAMASPMGITNTFVFLHKRDKRESAEFFLPKPQFSTPSQRVTTFCIKLKYKDNIVDECRCGGRVPVYHDSRLRNFFYGPFLKFEENLLVVEKKRKCGPDFPFGWFQSKVVLKGFKLS